MSWGEEGYLWLLILSPAVPALVYWGHRLRLQRIIRFMGESYSTSQRALQQKVGLKRRVLLFTLCYVFMVISAAQLRWGYEWRDIKQEGADIMIVVDVSKSMAAEDIQPNRIQRARREIADLVKMLKGDRVGLLPFAGIGFVQCPLTLDYQAIELFIDNLGQNMIPVSGTAIGSAIRLAHKSLMQGEGRDSIGKSIILITDGEDQESEPLAAARAAAKDGIRIYPIGIGSQGGSPIPEEGGGFVKDRQGRMVMSKLDETTLQQIASLSGGHYVRSTTGDLDLDVIYSQHIRGDLGQSELRESREKVWYERHPLFTFLAMLMLLMDGVMQAWRLRRCNY